MGEMADFYLNVENGGCEQCGEAECICDVLHEELNEDKKGA